MFEKFNQKTNFIDTDRDLYEYFLLRSNSLGDGISWFFTPTRAFDIANLIDSSMGEKSIIKDIPFYYFFPELGVFKCLSFEKIDEENNKKSKESNNLNYSKEKAPSIRDLISRFFPIYLDDLVEIKIYFKNQIIFQSTGPVKNLNINKESIFSILKSNDQTLKINFKLLAKGSDRLRHESESLILQTEEYLKKFNEPTFCQTIFSFLNNLKDPNYKHENPIFKFNPTFADERLKLWDANSQNFNLKFNKVKSYETFFEYLPFSKHSNEKLMSLDNIKTAEINAEKIKSSLSVSK